MIKVAFQISRRQIIQKVMFDPWIGIWKNKVVPYLTLNTRLNSTEIKYLSIKKEISVGNMGEDIYLLFLILESAFWIMISRLKTMKDKIYESDNIKNILHIRRSTSKINNKWQAGRKIFNSCNHLNIKQLSLKSIKNRNPI